MKRIISFILTLALLAGLGVPLTSAESPGEEIWYANKLLVGWRLDDGSILFNPQDTIQRNGNMLVELLNNDEEKTVILPKTTIEINRVLKIGSNTTIIADGAKIVQTGGAIPIIDHEIDALNYNSVSNVSITGGTWSISDKGGGNPSIMRFMHAKNITVDNVKMSVRYGEHAISFIACKDAVLSNSKLTSTGTPDKNGHEEVLQIDISTPFTAPNCARAGAEYADGQTCRNVTVSNCQLTGERGLCTNKVTYKDEAWQKKFGVTGTPAQVKKWNKKHHLNITLKNNKIIGKSGEAVCLANAAKFKVINNTIVSYGKDKNSSYTTGLNIRSFGKNDITSLYESKITDNKIKGGNIGLYVGTSSTNKFGKVTVKNNSIYCKKSKSRALMLFNCKKSVKNNKLYKWK